jgi:hypothetical protein
LHLPRFYWGLPRKNAPNVDADLWALLQWMIAGVGGEWRVEDLDATSSLYQVSAAGAG